MVWEWNWVEDPRLAHQKRFQILPSSTFQFSISILPIGHPDISDLVLAKQATTLLAPPLPSTDHQHLSWQDINVHCPTRVSNLDSQLPSLISLFIFVWSISETAVVSLYMGGLIVCRPSAQPKLAADHVSLWISPPLYMRMNLQCELGRCVHHIGGGVHFSVIFSEFACTKIGESVFLAKQR